jgi:hypothetical protein
MTSPAVGDGGVESEEIGELLLDVLAQLGSDGDVGGVGVVDGEHALGPGVGRNGRPEVVAEPVGEVGVARYAGLSVQLVLAFTGLSKFAESGSWCHRRTLVRMARRTLATEEQRLTFEGGTYAIGGATVTRSLPLSMTTDESTIGRCPDCSERIPSTWLLIEFEKDDGTTGCWAECPACSDVVRPK